MRLILILLILVMSVSAGLFVANLTEEQKAEQEVKIVEVPVPQVQEQINSVDVMVAREYIPVGTRISPELVDYRPWPEHLVLGEFVQTDGKGDGDVMGNIARSEFQVGEPIIMSKLANPEDPSFLATRLEEGMRAITIPVDSISGVAGFIYPGDRIDILVTHGVEFGMPNDNGLQPTEAVTELLIPDAKVIAVDKSTSIESGAGPVDASSLTLELSPKDAQRIRLAQDKGRLTMLLRAVKTAAATEEENTKETLANPTGTGDLSRITPPSYFPVLYNFEGEYTPEEVVSEESSSESMPTMSMTDGRKASTEVTIVRGSTVQVVGISRP